MAHERHPDDEILTRYLLGEELPAQDIDAVEERYFKDNQYFSHLLEIEDDLIGAYLLGKLSPRQKAKFEHHFLVVPRRRQKLEAQRAIAAFFRDTPAPQPFLTA